MDSCDPQTLSYREADDTLLAQTITRDVDAKAAVATVNKFNIALLANILLAYALGQVNVWAFVFLVLSGPFIVGIVFGLLALRKKRLANETFAKLPLWERHRINLILQRAGDSVVGVKAS